MVELGCGTGRLTAAVLRESPGLTELYRFTDLACRPLRAETLDVDEDFVAQGFADATADVVLAGHTLHHFPHSPERGGPVSREGVIFPSVAVWQKALHATGFALRAELSAGASGSVRHHLFHAVRETV